MDIFLLHLETPHPFFTPRSQLYKFHHHQGVSPSLTCLLAGCVGPIFKHCMKESGMIVKLLSPLESEISFGW